VTPRTVREVARARKIADGERLDFLAENAWKLDYMQSGRAFLWSIHTLSRTSRKHRNLRRAIDAAIRAYERERKK
jgi:hypothetical protein